MSSWTLPRTAGFSVHQPLSRIVTGLALMRAVHRQRQALAWLDARALDDIGLSAAAAQAEARRAPWDLPQGHQF